MKDPMTDGSKKPMSNRVNALLHRIYVSKDTYIEITVIRKKQ